MRRRRGDRRAERLLCFLLLAAGFSLCACGKGAPKADDTAPLYEIQAEKPAGLPAEGAVRAGVKALLLAKEEAGPDIWNAVQAEGFYRLAEKEYGWERAQARELLAVLMKDAVFEEGRALAGLVLGDMDGNGQLDMAVMVRETKSEDIYGAGALYFYRNGKQVYCFADKEFPYFWLSKSEMFWTDLDGDGTPEIVFETAGTGVGATGDWHKAVLRYTKDHMERLEIPSDVPAESGELGIQVDVFMEPEKNTYSAYCPYFDEAVTFYAQHEIENQDFSSGHAKVGGMSRGYFDAEPVVYEGRNAVRFSEYLYGENGHNHQIGTAYFILMWDEEGNGSVADWWVTGMLSEGKE